MHCTGKSFNASRFLKLGEPVPGIFWLTEQEQFDLVCKPHFICFCTRNLYFRFYISPFRKPTRQAWSNCILCWLHLQTVLFFFKEHSIVNVVCSSVGSSRCEQQCVKLTRWRLYFIWLPSPTCVHLHKHPSNIFQCGFDCDVS